MRINSLVAMYEKGAIISEHLIRGESQGKSCIKRLRPWRHGGGG
jgi:hypothetical protein